MTDEHIPLKAENAEDMQVYHSVARNYYDTNDVDSVIVQLRQKVREQATDIRDLLALREDNKRLLAEVAYWHELKEPGAAGWRGIAEKLRSELDAATTQIDQLEWEVRGVAEWRDEYQRIKKVSNDWCGKVERLESELTEAKETLLNHAQIQNELLFKIYKLTHD